MGRMGWKSVEPLTVCARGIETARKLFYEGVLIIQGQERASGTRTGFSGPSGSGSGQYTSCNSYTQLNTSFWINALLLDQMGTCITTRGTETPARGIGATDRIQPLLDHTCTVADPSPDTGVSHEGFSPAGMPTFWPCRNPISRNSTWQPLWDSPIGK